MTKPEVPSESVQMKSIASALPQQITKEVEIRSASPLTRFETIPLHCPVSLFREPHPPSCRLNCLTWKFNISENTFRKSWYCPFIKFETLDKNIKLYIPSTLNIALILWHTQLIVCAVKSYQGLNHGLSISVFKLIPCPMHWIVYVLANLDFIFEFYSSFSTAQNGPLCPDT